MVTQWRKDGNVELVIAATPDEIYRVVSDVTSTGERSNECRSASWLPHGPQSAELGARFRGRNRSRLARWSRVCEVIEAEPGRRFAFRTLPERLDPSRADSTTWRYERSPHPEGTLVRHSYEITRFPRRPFMGLYGVLLPQHKDMRPAMRYTLNCLAKTLSST